MFQNNALQEFIYKESFKPTTVHDFPLAQVLSCIHDGVVVVNAKGVIVYANPSYTRILNVPVERVIGREMRVVEPNARILTVLKTGEPILQEPLYLDSLNAEVIIDATPLYSNGKIIGGVTIFKQVGEVVGYYNAINKLNEIKKKGQKIVDGNDELQNPFKEIIGNEPVFLKSLNKASKVASSNATLFIQGESGVGKEVFATAIHNSSPRKNGPFIKVNCSAIPESLIESELFGYENGAFTGAKKGGKPGKFELAHGGTIFLDEIGDMPFDVQAKLLRVLQEREIERVGGSQTIKVDIRVIAATHQNLFEMVEKKRFREDLYYRINVIPIHIPALRERPKDVELLIQHFVTKFSEVYNKKLIVGKQVLDILTSYHWPGNIRQLVNVIEHSVILCDENVIQKVHLPQYLLHQNSSQTNASQININQIDGSQIEKEIQLVEEQAQEQNKCDSTNLFDERVQIIQALKETNYNRSKAMETLGISRRTFYKKLKKYNIVLN